MTNNQMTNNKKAKHQNAWLSKIRDFSKSWALSYLQMVAMKRLEFSIFSKILFMGYQNQ